MKIISWNVNGIRSILKKGFLDFINKYDPDILCLQETKASQENVQLNLSQYHQYWNSAQKKGYSGTCVFTKEKPLNVENGILLDLHDKEGRTITLEYPTFFLVNVYVPNSKRDLSRLEYRCKQWDVDFLNYLKNIERKKPVIFCGDLNVAHTENDLAFPKANINNHGFTAEERAGFDHIVESGFVDIFREFEKSSGHYTWWSQFNRCRERDIGWRIDYFLISPSLRSRIKKASILKDVMGSDHCPITLELSL
ncbi:exodeoxyribonuclease [Parachlamydia acanthamoebae UV-7]|uniref:Exodeoxyribonuclease n=2 Tax=Parachlamydia acanthamoebae TaxID=83552 RepID=F8KZW2_PARAV|nr:exodeoxyribonuclease III [Parachlamydia acanthamoebae]KIA77769.1 Exodeoxyribonuclease [Parachlamydia acanthamoebae]CCB86471.1 exodeoxyribonuclease [Parachlamydia acanthamoebae UV-7]